MWIVARCFLFLWLILARLLEFSGKQIPNAPRSGVGAMTFSNHLCFCFVFVLFCFVFVCLFVCLFVRSKLN